MSPISREHQIFMKFESVFTNKQPRERIMKVLKHIFNIFLYPVRSFKRSQLLSMFYVTYKQFFFTGSSFSPNKLYYFSPCRYSQFNLLKQDGPQDCFSCSKINLDVLLLHALNKVKRIIVTHIHENLPNRILNIHGDCVKILRL